MRIPGLTFIIIPILIWLGYAYGGYVISSVETFYNTYGILGILLSYILFFILEIGIRMFFELDGEFEDFLSFKPAILVWDILVYINNKLTVKL